MTLEKEFSYFKAHQKELVRRYKGKVIVIVGEEVIGSYDTELDAYVQTKKTRKAGTFLVQKCLPGEQSYKRTFHTRVALR